MKAGRKLMTMAHNFISIRRRENLFEQDQDTWGLEVELKNIKKLYTMHHRVPDK